MLPFVTEMMRGRAVRLLVLAVCLACSCTRHGALPEPGTSSYRDLCTAFYLGLAALQSGEDVNARKGLSEATKVAPGEPAGWLNLGLLDFRQQNFDSAYTSVSRALTLVSDDSRIEALLGIIESHRGKQAESLAHLKHAVDLDGHNLKAVYALAQETERENTPETDAQAQSFFERILQLQPNNVAVLLDDIRLASKRNQVERSRAAVKALCSEAESLPAEAKEQLQQLDAQVKTGNIRPAAIQVQFLKNLLVRAPAYRQSLDQVRTPATSAGEPFLTFFKLPSPNAAPDPIDSAISWTRDDKLRGTAVYYESGDSKPQAISVAGDPTHVAVADLNYNFKTDIVTADDTGLHFVGSAQQPHLAAGILQASYTGVWAFDYDLDGDLDLILGSRTGPPLVLRNNGDGSYKPVHPFSGVEGVTGFASADIDGDGDPDVAFLDSTHHLVLFRNERLGDYRKRDTPPITASALTAGDVTGDHRSDFIFVAQDGSVRTLSGRKLAVTNPGATLLLADLDNNGALDLIAGNRIFLSDNQHFTEVKAPPAVVITGIADFNNDGALDLLTPEGAFLTHLTRNYHWQTIRPRAARTGGDQRMNSFGIGGEIELRSQLLTQKQIITAPQMHFGMGSHTQAGSFARIAWPNGLIQTEFGLKPDGDLLAEQRLKGSCPYLFTWNGHKMEFVKDVAPMSGALGAHDFRGGTALVRQTRQWFTVDGTQLQAKDNEYRLSVTDEYWETYFIDQYQLLAVDHPRTTYLWVDERVTDPPTPARSYLTDLPQRFATTEMTPFIPGLYRGIGRDHFVELTVPVNAPRHTPLYLIAQGSFKPWDDSTLMAFTQARGTEVHDLSLESEDHGTWKPIHAHLGVPAGRNKTVVLDISGLHHFRLKTNLDIEWTSLRWAIPATGDHQEIVPLRNAVLQHRGYSVVSGVRELPDYDRLAFSGQRWPSLEGLYTRYGDVRELLTNPDGRFVIANSGDELQMTFQALPALPAERVRDFIFIGDGWIKEGDFGFKTSTTVLPLPFPGMTHYRGSSTDLVAQTAYRQHPQDWQQFHTRYVDPR